MRIEKLFLCFAFITTSLCASAQGSFENLNFEEANIALLADGQIVTANALPGWTVYANGTPQQWVSYDGIELPAVAAIADSLTPSLLIDGKYTAVLAGPGLVNGISVSMGQSGVIPAGSESLTFLGSIGLTVSFAGHAIATERLGLGGTGGILFGGDISAYAGQSGQLLFQTSGLNNGVNLLDDITFSTQPIPEPSVLAIHVVGALLLSAVAILTRSRRRPANTMFASIGSAIMRRCQL